MAKEIAKKLRELCYSDRPWGLKEKILAYADELELGVHQPKQRTPAQNKGLHLGLQMIADSLNLSGLDMRTVLKPEVNIDWTKDSVKEYIFRPVMKLAVGKESTTELEKTSGEIEKVWDTVMRFLGEKHGVEFIPFPSEASIAPMIGVAVDMLN